MGGYGSARLGFKYPELFGAMSIVGAGPMQTNLLDAPRAGRARAQEVLNRVYSGDPDYFLAVSPLKLAEQNASKVAKGSSVRIVIGAEDNTLPANLAIHKHLESLKVPHTYQELPGIGHTRWRFCERWAMAIGTSTRQRSLKG
jgi:enterochelin esterase-like enzyme